VELRLSHINDCDIECGVVYTSNIVDIADTKLSVLSVLVAIHLRNVG